jgi:Tfp pilus assembly protein PilX
MILLVLTILGITALRTSSLQQLMAGNIQESTRAFEATESGLDWAFIIMGNFNQISSATAPASIDLPSFNVTGQPGQTDSLRASVTVYRTIQLQTTNNFSNRTERSSGASTNFAYLDQVAVGRTGAVLTAPFAQDVKQQGIRQKIPAQSGDTFSSSAAN